MRKQSGQHIRLQMTYQRTSSFIRQIYQIEEEELERIESNPRSRDPQNIFINDYDV